MNLIFDIGYNKGEFTNVCFQTYPACKVVGVEANTSLIYHVPQTPQLTLINKLASNKGGEEKEFFIEPHQDGISTACKEFIENSRFTKGSKYLRPNSANWTLKTKVQTTTIDEMIESYGNPDLIKVDVEGYEYEVLSGLTAKQRKICWEWHEEQFDTLLKTIEHLRNVGYTEFGMIGYFDEGNVFDKFTYSELGDPYLAEPNAYYSWAELEEEFSKMVNPQRRVDYGMMWCK